MYLRKEKGKALLSQMLLAIFSIIFKPFFFLLKKEIRFFEDRKYWIDNAYFQYLYTLEHRKDICCVYLNQYEGEQRTFPGTCVKKYSFLHLWYFIHANKLIFSYDTAPFYFNATWVRFKKILKPFTKLIFLQHWIINAEIPTLRKSNTEFDLFICSSEQEREFIKKWSWYDKELKVCWLARLDIPAEKKLSTVSKTILFMPTWRIDLGELNEQQFTKTSYYQKINEFLNHPPLHDMLEKSTITINYVIHQKFYKYKELFSSPSKYITIITNLQEKENDIAYMIRHCDAFITDFSSVLFDVWYFHKPSVYYQFEPYHYSWTLNLPFRKLFWPVTTTLEQTLDELQQIIDNAFIMEKKYSDHVDDFFPFQDGKNRKRINTEISCVEKS